MEDLAGLTFSPSPSTIQPKSAPPNQSRFPQNTTNPPPPATTTTYAPIPSRTSPNYNAFNLRTQVPQTTAPTLTGQQQKASAGGRDSFAALSAFSGITTTRAGAAAGGGGGGTLEQQRLERERLRREAEEKQKRDVDLHFGAEEFWERHSGMNTPTIITTDTYASRSSVFLFGLLCV